MPLGSGRSPFHPQGPEVYGHVCRSSLRPASLLPATNALRGGDLAKPVGVSATLCSFGALQPEAPARSLPCGQVEWCGHRVPAVPRLLTHGFRWPQCEVGDIAPRPGEPGSERLWLAEVSQLPLPSDSKAAPHKLD